MLKKFIKIFYFLFFIAFLASISIFYFSDKNINATNKSRTFYLFNQSVAATNLPLLSNDTKDIIEYKDDIELYKKNKKNYKFFDLIKN